MFKCSCVREDYFIVPWSWFSWRVCSVLLSEGRVGPVNPGGLWRETKPSSLHWQPLLENLPLPQFRLWINHCHIYYLLIFIAPKMCCHLRILYWRYSIWYAEVESICFVNCVLVKDKFQKEHSIWFSDYNLIRLSLAN